MLVRAGYLGSRLECRSRLTVLCAMDDLRLGPRLRAVPSGPRQSAEGS